MAEYYFFPSLALMSLKNKGHIKVKLLKHFGWALLPASCPLRVQPPSNIAHVWVLFSVCFSLIYFSYHPTLDLGSSCCDTDL